MAQGARERSCGVSLIRTLVLLMGVLFSWPKQPPEAAPLNTITLQNGISAYEFGVNTNIQTLVLGHPRFSRLD